MKRRRPERLRARRWAILAGVCGLLSLAAGARSVEAGRTQISNRGLTFERTIAPILRARCARCHEGTLARAGLDTGSLGGLLAGGHGGPAIVPGKPRDSRLLQLIQSGRMPLGGPRLRPAEVQLIERWLEQGAAGLSTERHWAFRPLPKSSRTPDIDAFLDRRLAAAGIRAATPASPRDLLRRVNFDLVGVPPTPAELDDFLRDPSDQAFRKVTDRLLASPQYGERWARHWLDPAGFADSEGVLQEDRLRPNAWRYRDYVIRSLNADKPFDVFIQEQLAGDELVDFRTVSRFTPEVIDVLSATGFLRTAVDATRDDFNAHQYGEYQYRMLNDTQTIVAGSLLGLTIQCARCHDHKYEPISQRDYYAFQALFAGGVRPRGSVLPSARRQIVAATEAEQADAARVNREVESALASLANREAQVLAQHQAGAFDARASGVPEAERKEVAATLADPAKSKSAAGKSLLDRHRALIPSHETLLKESPSYREQWQAIQKERSAATGRRIEYPQIRAFYDLDASPPPTPILVRGEWLKPADVQEPGVPTFLARIAGPLPAFEPSKGSTGRRHALARWITRRENPLTGRAIVNRVWYHHFGEGLTSSLDNLGRSGEKPSQPELLDALAGWFVQPKTEGGAGWSLKALHQLIIHSRAYRRSSATNEGAVRTDPNNRLLWRQRPRRIDADALRDSVLAVAGTLDARQFGEPVPLETRPGGEIVAQGDEARGRRSIYLTIRRSTPVSFLNAFDAPVLETNCSRRGVSTTATQSLALLNGTFIQAQARHFAARLRAEAGSGTPEALIRSAYRLALSREPTVGEVSEGTAFLAEQRIHHAGTKTSTPADLALADLCQALLCSNEFAYLD